MRRTALILVAAVSLSASVLPAAAQEGSGPDRELPASVAELKLSSPRSAQGAGIPGIATAKIDATLLGVTGIRQVLVQLSADAPAVRAAGGADPAGQRAALADVRSQQASILERAADLDARVLGQGQRAVNVVALEIDAARLANLAADPNVVTIRPVIDYEVALGETVPYIGAAEVQSQGFNGSGVSVAVLDSGIDYTHAALGGTGTPAAYEAAYGTDPADPRNTTRDGLFPTAKIVGGYDFVGEDWPFGDLAPDPDPIDYQGHGTHVADIIGGGQGVAPGVDLYAVKVCSAVSTQCSGVALIQGMDFAVDPNGDGDLSDHVDIINMSLGADYGQAFDDDLSQAVQNASAVGVLTVAAAGNAADKPYVTGAPAAAPSALSVAETQVPSAILPLLTVDEPADIAGDYPSVFQPWSVPRTDPLTAPLVYGAGGNLDGCTPFAADLTGTIVLVDRGGCNFTLKISHIGQAGGEAGIIGLTAPGAPFGGGDGGDRPIDIDAYMISQADANTLKVTAGVVMTIDPANGLALVGQMVGASSRGPSISYNTIKPEIGAPGASVSAIAGSGDDRGPFGGTSGAAPMVSGAAALLTQAYPDRAPAEIKSVLMNTAEIEILTQPEELGGALAPVTRIGGGEVRVDRALTTRAAAWDSELQTGALSFGFHDVWRARVRTTREVTVRNYGNRPLVYRVVPTFRFQDDVDNGAVQISAPRRVRVPANGTATFKVALTIDGAALREWGLNSGDQGASGETLGVHEYDGYVWLQDPRRGSPDLHLAWQVLPRKAGHVHGRRTVAVHPVPDADYSSGTGRFVNVGVGTARIDSYSLIGRSPDLPEAGLGDQAPIIDLRYVGVATFPVPAGFCSNVDSYVMQFAINTWERQVHGDVPGVFEIDLDVDQDGVPDYAVFNWDLGYPGIGDGRNVTWVLDFATGGLSAFFFTEHNTNSANTVLTICGEQIGQNAANLLQPMTVDVLATDIYFAGAVTDSITGMRIAPGGERFLGLPTDIGPRATGEVTVQDFGRAGTNPSEHGLLLVLTGSRGDGISGAPEGREAIVIRIAGGKGRGGGKYVR